MLSIMVYKNIHLLGVLMVFLALGGAILQGATGNTAEQPWRRIVSITHGVGLILLLGAGFGMLARMEIYWPWPGWVTAKALIWVLLGLFLMLARRPGGSKWSWWTTLVLGALAAYLAINKPF